MKKGINFIIISCLLIIGGLIILAKEKKFTFLVNKKQLQENLDIFVNPRPNQEVNNPFLVKIKINDSLNYLYKVKVYDLDLNLLYEGNLRLEDGYFVDFIKITKINKVPQSAIVQVYRYNEKDGAEILLAKQLIKFEGISIIGLTNTDLFNEKKAFVRIKNKEFKVELANTLETRTKGLSGRKKISEDEAMLFVFENSGYHSFWMKDMSFDIDIIWIYYDTIVDIQENIKHPSVPKQDLEIYSPKLKANMALEILAGTASKYRFSVGDQVFVYK